MGSVSCPFCLDFVTIDKFSSILLQFLPYFLIFDIRFEVREHQWREREREHATADNWEELMMSL